MGEGYQRMLPLLSDENRFYWTSGSEGVLRMLRCQACSTWIHPPRPICSTCLSKDLAPEALSGKGRVFSYTLNCKSWGAGLDVPYVIGVVELNEQPGLRLTSNVRGIAPEDVCIGTRVQVTFEQDEDVWLPMFVPDEMAAA